MIKLMAMAGGVCLFAVAGTAGMKMMDNERAGAIAKFEITEAEMPLMKACEELLRFDDIEFRSGVSEISGCGCMTREIHDSIQPREAAYAVAVLPTMILSEVKPEAVEVKLPDLEKQMQAKFQMTKARVRTVSDMIAISVATCSKPELYMSPEEKAQAAAEKASKAEKSRVAFDQAVKSGAMTRAEADRRLASMN